MLDIKDRPTIRALLRCGERACVLADGMGQEQRMSGRSPMIDGRPGESHLVSAIGMQSHSVVPGL